MGCCVAAGARRDSVESMEALPPMSKLSVQIGAVTDIGGHNKKENQDVYFIQQGWMGDSGRHLWGVIDGHGSEGRKASVYCKSRLPMMLDTLYAPTNKTHVVEKAIASAFNSVHNMLCNRSVSHVNAAHSGATCTIGILDQRNLTVGFVGDSQALLITQANPNSEHKQAWFSRCHQFTEADETARVIEAGGAVERSRSAGGQGPLRVYFPGEPHPGLMVSRSLGDGDAHRLGVSASPDFFHKTISAQDRYLVVCSDGVWDVMTPERVIEICVKCGEDVQACAAAIVRESRHSWDRLPRCDNITALVVAMRDPPAESAGGPGGVVEVSNPMESSGGAKYFTPNTSPRKPQYSSGDW